MTHAAAITHIMELCEDGDLSGVDMKLKIQPGLLNIRDGNGRTPLHRAAQSGNMELLLLLIDKGAIVDAESEEGHTPLHFGAFAGQISAITVLLEKGAFIDHQGLDGCVPLHFACGQGKQETVQFLVERGANLKIPNKKGEFPVHWAVKNEHRDLAKAVNDMYHKRPENASGQKSWPMRQTVQGDISLDFVDNGSKERASENKEMGMFYSEKNDTVRSHTLRVVEDEEVSALIDRAKHLQGANF